MPPHRWTVGQTIGRAALIAVFAATMACDRLTKHAAAVMLEGEPGRSYLAGTVRVGYAENAGGFLSLGASLPAGFRVACFTVLTGLALVATAVVAVRWRRRGWVPFGLALFMAGGTSNWIDRVARGRVIDFLNLGVGPVRTGIFNVADVAILVGVAIVLIGEWRASVRAI